MTSRGDELELQPGESAELILDPELPLPLDLSCLNCGYNLRGLYGNPIRCPECFHFSPRLVPESLLPAGETKSPSREDVILKDLVTRGSLPAVALALFLLPACVLLLLEGGWPVWLMPPLSWCAGVVGLSGLVLFWRRCRGVEGWCIAFCRYLFVASISVLINAFLIGALAIGAAILFESGPIAFILLGFLICGVFFANPMVGLNKFASNQLRATAGRVLLREIEREADRANRNAQL